MQTAQTRSAPTVLIPDLPGWADASLIVGASLLVALMAQVSIPLPFSPVPITGQTFAVLLVGAALGARRGAASLLLYLLEGAVGLPVFAGGTGGPAVLLGPTGGYLIGFVAAAWLVGALAGRGLDRRLPHALLAFLAGEAVIFLCGAAVLAVYVGPANALPLGVIPFIPGELIKIALAAAALPAAWRIAYGGIGPNERR
jgi:biotin transport system substrate-specific component